MNESGNPASATRCKRLTAAILLGGLLVLLAGCGQRGPLYLPDEHPDGNGTQQEAETEDGEKDEETPGT